MQITQQPHPGIQLVGAQREKMKKPRRAVSALRPE